MNGMTPQVKRLYVYKLDHDVGMNPNPFGGYCTLTYCKALMRSAIAKYVTERQNAQPAMTVDQMGIWVVGIAAKKLNDRTIERYGHIIYAMQVTEILSHAQYFNDPRFEYKKLIASKEEEDIIETDEKHGFHFFRNNKEPRLCGDNQQKNLDMSCMGIGCEYVLVSDCFEYYGVESYRHLKLLDYLGLSENDTLRGYRLYIENSEKDIPYEYSEYIKNDFRNRKCLSRPTFSHPGFIIPSSMRL